MSSAFYSNDIKSFLHQSEDEIFGIISKANEYDLLIKQKDAWVLQIQLLKKCLVNTLREVLFLNIQYLGLVAE